MLSLFLIAFLVFMAIGIPVALAMGGSALVYTFLTSGISPTLLIQTTFAGMASFPLLAIPLFILAGNLMNEGGITDDLVGFSRQLVGHISGGLGLTTIVACAIFASISGSAVATAAAIGTVMFPAMRRAGYDDEVSSAVTATASCMGPILPPSIPFIIYGVIAQVSIGALFIAGIIPGLLLGGCLMIYMLFVARRDGYPREPRASMRNIFTGTLRALPSLVMPLIIIGGIWGGVFTPTEAAGIAVVYAFMVGFFVYRRLKLSRLYRLLLTSGVEAAVVMLLLGLSEPFAWVVAVEQVPMKVMESLVHLSSSPYVFLILVNILLLIIGIPLETAPALAIVTPVLVPIAERMGIDPLHFGVIVCFNLVLGLITPPVGGVLFSVCGITGLSLERLSRAIWIPFLIAVGVLLIVTFVPALSTFLPRLFLPS
ncbi:MAG TPA: TRAP transporter large permease [Syntrophales bacterium]|nr:TRAP transporter large permease [Syntrophales bacterium]HOX93355.1 TRAP transporter large permease [Syntrophales bacterium]HPI56100.1 TRAP transporter large permease [Syntrophales bacterium]HPN24010.1 TRAP transporter large permease [Syntrophales bacterium]HQM28289.1 TRAP transporter large permease [Syntrophales bacterium]